VSVNSTLRNSRYIQAGTPFRCFIYQANVTIYVWNIKHLSLSIAFCVLLIKVLVSALDF